MKAKTFYILCECIENGIEFGYHRAFKHTENPSAETIKESIYRETINAVCEYFDFPDEGK